MSTHSIADSFLPVTALRSFMSHFDRSTVPPARQAPDSPRPYRTTPPEMPVETPAETRAMAVAARFFPALAYGQRRTLVRAIARMTEHPDSPRFEVEIRAAYRGAVVEAPVTEVK